MITGKMYIQRCRAVRYGVNSRVLQAQSRPDLLAAEGSTTGSGSQQLHSPEGRSYPCDDEKTSPLSSDADL